MAAFSTVLALAGCSATRHIPQGSYLLDKVSIEVDDSSKIDIPNRKLINYVRQTPNHKVLGLARLQLGVYNLSSNDSTGFNRWLRKVGEEPVVYDSTLTEMSVRQLRQALFNAGYHNASVDYEAVSEKQKRMAVRYKLHPGLPYTISSLSYRIEDPGIEATILSDSILFPIKVGNNLDMNVLDEQRAFIVERMRNKGYFAMGKEYISFLADTLANSKEVDLTMVVSRPKAATDSLQTNAAHRRYRFGKVIIVTDFVPGDNSSDFRLHAADSVFYKGLEILYGTDRYLSAKELNEQCFIRPGELYSTTCIDRTYEALNRLSILKYVNIITQPAGSSDNNEWLDAYILLSRTKKMGVTVELEGTNSEGDFGLGGGVTFQHRNLAHGGEMLTAKVRGAYESLSGNFEGLINNSYTEIAGEVGITFPKFKAPLLSTSFKQKMRASTEFALTFMRQTRPEYTRIIAGGTWRYKWADRAGFTRRTFDLVDINVVRLPKSTLNFIDNIAPDNPLLRYSYEDHFIMRLGYSIVRTNRRPASSGIGAYMFQTDTYTARASAETAGALLYAISSLTGMKRSDGVYKIFGIQYSQYLKGEADYTFNHRFSTRNSISFHAGGGIVFPYGNSTMVPFEKRFYAGGANGVRGWSVRTLGPGSYNSRNAVSDFINQCGDILLNLNLEYRNKLFWVFEGALFIDAGNIWTIRDYPNQPGGVFRFNSFYKQIAAAYGIGLRMDFDYFLIRFDLGMKAHDPAMDHEHWPIIHPNWHRDATFHFSVGYPF